MHDHRTAATGTPVPSTVTGLGVCDALRVRLEPMQVAWLIDELEELRTPLEEQLQATPDGEARDAVERELAALRRMRAQLPAAGAGIGAVFCGPADSVAALVRASLRTCAAALAELTQGPLRGDAATRDALRRTAAAAEAWATTHLDRQAVESYTFDPDS